MTVIPFGISGRLLLPSPKAMDLNRESLCSLREECLIPGRELSRGEIGDILIRCYFSASARSDNCTNFEAFSSSLSFVK